MYDIKYLIMYNIFYIYYWRRYNNAVRACVSACVMCECNPQSSQGNGFSGGSVTLSNLPLNVSDQQQADPKCASTGLFGV